jgi:hypothetical protein
MTEINEMETQKLYKGQWNKTNVSLKR